MNKLEKGLFENLTQNSGFYIKDYYSEYLNSSKWMAILENNDFVYAVIVCKYNDCDFEYEEAKVFLEKNYFKKSCYESKNVCKLLESLQTKP